VDSCADFDAPGAFERLLAVCTGVKQDHRLKGSKAGDWDDFPEDGRTLYLGASTSAVKLRLYEKGRQPEYVHLERPDWARIEVQVRPAKEAKEKFAQLDPLEVWGASAWSRSIAAAVLQEHVDPHPAGTTYRLPELERSFRWMCAQYGPTLVELVNELGSWECVGKSIEDELKRLKRQGH
jgi:hypothetical protein